jgi:hypothetical protein
MKDIEHLKNRIDSIIELYTEKMIGKAEIGSYTEAANFQIKISELEYVLIIINELKKAK